MSPNFTVKPIFHDSQVLCANKKSGGGKVRGEREERRRVQSSEPSVSC